MDPSSTEGRSWAERLLAFRTDKQWAQFKEDHKKIAATAVGKAIKAAMEPSPEVTPKTELKLAKAVTRAMLKEAEVVSKMIENLALQGKSGEETYWAVSEYFAAKIAKKGRVFYEKAKNSDRPTGWVSIEVDPRIVRGEVVTEKELMRLVLKAEGEEKFIIPFEGAVNVLQSAVDEIRNAIAQQAESPEVGAPRQVPQVPRATLTAL